MPKIFNVHADCKPGLHYMADISRIVSEMKKMTDRGQYFTVNRARQYGKTTVLRALARYLRNDYAVVSLDFQKEMSAAKFQNEHTFSAAFAAAFLAKLDSSQMQEPEGHAAVNRLYDMAASRREELELVELFQCLSLICRYSIKPVVLMIDEADSAADNQVFLDFLSQLRGYYIDRDETPSFRSVILAGVYDIRNIRQKIRPQEEHTRNSPWNIAADFLVDMSLSASEIEGMLLEYEADYHTGMNTAEMAGMLYDYTSGYPYLVSRLCKLMDEQVKGSLEFPDARLAWTKKGFLAAVLQELLFYGKEIAYVPGTRYVEMALMFGFLKKTGGCVTIANRIFDVLLYNFFLTSPDMQQKELYSAALKDRNQYIEGGRLNMELVLQKFILHFQELYGRQEADFYEADGRKYFLLYLKPVINGTGNYYIESQTRDMERTDVIIDYRGEQFVIEMKIWRGRAYHEKGEKQLLDYLDYYRLSKGYMVVFNFNKKKETGIRNVRFGDKILVEAFL